MSLRAERGIPSLRQKAGSVCVHPDMGVAPRDTPFEAAGDTRAKGRIAETAAVRWLQREGFEIVETNYAIRAGEIDIVAIDPEPGPERLPDAPGTLCFVEVKARRSDEFGPALAAVTPRKQRRIGQAARAFLMSFEWSGPCRFDVLAMDRGADGWEVSLVRDAFLLA